MITCQECEAEFEVVHDSIVQPDFCTFCGSKLEYDDEDLFEDDDEEENWSLDS